MCLYVNSYTSVNLTTPREEKYACMGVRRCGREDNLTSPDVLTVGHCSQLSEPELAEDAGGVGRGCDGDADRCSALGEQLQGLGGEGGSEPRHPPVLPATQDHQLRPLLRPAHRRHVHPSPHVAQELKNAERILQLCITKKHSGWQKIGDRSYISKNCPFNLFVQKRNRLPFHFIRTACEPRAVLLLGLLAINTLPRSTGQGNLEYTNHEASLKNV